MLVLSNVLLSDALAHICQFSARHLEVKSEVILGSYNYKLKNTIVIYSHLWVLRSSDVTQVKLR